ncbi:MAG: TIGR03667 family PPOX class F420-dependent oxidoreductase [Omnitrophica WOR_2 bacterium]
MLNLDENTEFGARVIRRLAEEQVIWLTTMKPDGTPQPTPVWYLWDGESFLIYSQPNTYKLRNIAGNPRVSINFNCTESGGDVVVFYGEAYIDKNTPPVHHNPAYVNKYREGIAGIDMTPESMGGSYQVPIRVKPERVRGF